MNYQKVNSYIVTTLVKIRGLVNDSYISTSLGTLIINNEDNGNDTEIVQDGDTVAVKLKTPLNYDETITGEIYLYSINSFGGYEITHQDEFNITTLESPTVVKPKPTKPTEIITTPLELDVNHITEFLLQIGPLAYDVSVDYMTEDNTAIAGEDYIFTSGTATIQAGESSTVIEIEIIGDTVSESLETFSLILTNPVGADFPPGVTEISATRIIIDDD